MASNTLGVVNKFEFSLAIAGILGTALGAVLGARTTLRAEQSRQAEQERIWWRQERKSAYREFINGCSRVNLAILQAARDASALEKAKAVPVSGGRDEARRQRVIHEALKEAVKSSELVKSLLEDQLHPASLDVRLVGSKEAGAIASQLYEQLSSSKAFMDSAAPEGSHESHVEAIRQFTLLRDKFVNQARTEFGSD